MSTLRIRPNSKTAVRVAALLVALTAFPPLTGCGDDAETLETGEVALQWQVGPRGCQDADTHLVEVTATPVGGNGGQMWSFACEARRANIRELPVGSYEFHVSGRTTNGNQTFVGETDEVLVRPGGFTTVPPVVLAATPASLAVRWDFGGPFCSHVEVETVEVFTFDPFGTMEGHAVAPCDDGSVVIETRPGSYDIVVQAISARGELLFESVRSVVLARGDATMEHLTLEPVQPTE